MYMWLYLNPTTKSLLKTHFGGAGVPHGAKSLKSTHLLEKPLRSYLSPYVAAVQTICTRNVYVCCTNPQHIPYTTLAIHPIYRII